MAGKQKAKRESKRLAEAILRGAGVDDFEWEESNRGHCRVKFYRGGKFRQIGFAASQ